MRSLIQDIRYGWRMLLKKPGFTIVAALALALGIGANSAIFSIINAILLKPLPFDDLDRIVAVWEKAPQSGERNSVAVANYLDWREQNNSFESLAIYKYWSANLGSIEPPERVRGVHVSPNLLDNETLAKRFWPNGDAVGKYIRFGSRREIVGVVGDVKHQIVMPMMPDFYAPLAQQTPETMSLVARARSQPLALAGPIRHEIQAIDPDQPVFEIKTMVQVRDRMIMPFRVLGTLLSAFGIFALILAATGIYGVMAYAVSKRTREIGVRMALGAQRGDILKLFVIGQGMWVTAIGIIIGLAGAVGLAQVLKGVFFGLVTIDWTIGAGVTLLMAGVSLLACYIPARRAAKVDPMVALRYE